MLMKKMLWYQSTDMKHGNLVRGSGTRQRERAVHITKKRVGAVTSADA